MNRQEAIAALGGHLTAREQIISFRVSSILPQSVNEHDVDGGIKAFCDLALAGLEAATESDRAEDRDALLAAAEAVLPHLPGLDSETLYLDGTSHIKPRMDLVAAIRLAKEPR